jgi:hypothetical protein
MWRVIKHAMDRLNFGDLVFGVYQLALHHATMNDVDAVEGREVTEAAMIEHLIWVRARVRVCACFEAGVLLAVAAAAAAVRTPGVQGPP